MVVVELDANESVMLLLLPDSLDTASPSIVLPVIDIGTSVKNEIKHQLIYYVLYYGLYYLRIFTMDIAYCIAREKVFFESFIIWLKN